MKKKIYILSCKLSQAYFSFLAFIMKKLSGPVYKTIRNLIIYQSNVNAQDEKGLTALIIG